MPRTNRKITTSRQDALRPFVCLGTVQAEQNSSTATAETRCAMHCHEFSPAKVDGRNVEYNGRPRLALFTRCVPYQPYQLFIPAGASPAASWRIARNDDTTSSRIQSRKFILVMMSCGEVVKWLGFGSLRPGMAADALNKSSSISR